MDQTTAADSDRRRRSAAPAQLDAAADNIGRVRPRSDVEQQPGEDEQPEFVNAERFNHHLTCSLTLPASFARVPIPDGLQYYHEQIGLPPDCSYFINIGIGRPTT